MNRSHRCLLLLLAACPVFAANLPAKADIKASTSKSAPKASTAMVDSETQQEQSYRVDKPGTITFTVGVKIKGKVEKPQVVIFLPKEKPVYRPVTLEKSYVKDIMKPLRFTPGAE